MAARLKVLFFLVLNTLILLLDNIYVRFGDNLYLQVVGIHMDTNCVPLIADLFLYCYEFQFMTKLSIFG